MQFQEIIIYFLSLSSVMTLEVLHLLLNSKVALVCFALLLYEGFSLSPIKLISLEDI